MCTSPSTSKFLKAPHQRGLLFCLLEAQPQEAQVHLQGAIGVEAKAVQRDVCSLLPLPETKEAEAAQTSSHQLSPKALARGRNRVAPAPPATVLRVQEGKAWGTWQFPHWVTTTPRAELFILVCRAPTSQTLCRFQDPSECPEDSILETPGTPLGGAKGPSAPRAIPRI